MDPLRGMLVCVRFEGNCLLPYEGWPLPCEGWWIRGMVYDSRGDDPVHLTAGGNCALLDRAREQGLGPDWRRERTAAAVEIEVALCLALGAPLPAELAEPLAAVVAWLL